MTPSGMQRRGASTDSRTVAQLRHTVRACGCHSGQCEEYCPPECDAVQVALMYQCIERKNCLCLQGIKASHPKFTDSTVVQKVVNFIPDYTASHLFTKRLDHT